MMIYEDEFGEKCSFKIDHGKMKYNFESIRSEDFNVSEIMEILDNVISGVNPFDLWVLKNYIESKDIKRVTELGCGSTTYFINKLGVDCKSFALDKMITEDIEYVKCDIFSSADIILESCRESEMFLIDSLHTAAMAKFYHENILKYINIPIFMHDWHNTSLPTYSEQVYFVDNILDKDYELFLMTCLFNKSVYDFCAGEPCSAIFTKIETT